MIRAGPGSSKANFAGQRRDFEIRTRQAARLGEAARQKDFAGKTFRDNLGAAGSTAGTRGPWPAASAAVSGGSGGR
jgi:hypothetical protein